MLVFLIFASPAQGKRWQTRWEIRLAPASTSFDFCSYGSKAARSDDSSDLPVVKSNSIFSVPVLFDFLDK